jgi:hypothetical protein
MNDVLNSRNTGELLSQGSIIFFPSFSSMQSARQQLPSRIHQMLAASIFLDKASRLRFFFR